MTPRERVRLAVVARMNARKIKRSGLADMAGLSPKTLRSFLAKDGPDPRPWTEAAIEGVLWPDEPGKLERIKHETEDEHVRRRVAELPPDVTDDERAELVRYLQFMRRRNGHDL